MCVHLQLCISLHTDGHTYWKAHFTWSLLSSVNEFSGENECTFENFVAHDDCIIDSSSEIVAEALKCKQLLFFRSLILYKVN